ncbi:DUF6207 family protein [Streptomyces sp. NPDC003697]
MLERGEPADVLFAELVAFGLELLNGSVDVLRRPEHAHLSEPGLLVIDVAGFNDDTVFAFQAAIAQIWGTAVAERTTQDARQPGVLLRMYTDLRQVLEEAPPPVPAPSAT